LSTAAEHIEGHNRKTFPDTRSGWPKPVCLRSFSCETVHHRRTDNKYILAQKSCHFAVSSR
uniref:C2H2-type domain-containing protein n=1 Tax=Haemonchus placei TaxID=6290 RepID=A0A0N4X9X1_HAEPC